MWRIPVSRHAFSGDGPGRWLACHNHGMRLFTIDEKQIADKMNMYPHGILRSSGLVVIVIEQCYVEITT